MVYFTLHGPSFKKWISFYIKEHFKLEIKIKTQKSNIRKKPLVREVGLPGNIHLCGHQTSSMYACESQQGGQRAPVAGDGSQLHTWPTHSCSFTITEEVIPASSKNICYQLQTLTMKHIKYTRHLPRPNSMYHTHKHTQMLPLHTYAEGHYLRFTMFRPLHLHAASAPTLPTHTLSIDRLQMATTDTRSTIWTIFLNSQNPLESNVFWYTVYIRHNTELKPH